jgi:hypothetical protein
MTLTNPELLNRAGAIARFQCEQWPATKAGRIPVCDIASGLETADI